MPDAFVEPRRQMIAAVRRGVRETRQYLGSDVLDESVANALMTVPRHEFVPETMQDLAYDNRPLPIGHDQTISQPYIVAIMTQLLGINENSVVLEIGTGCGYQAAVLSQVAAKVISLERIAALADSARMRLHRLGYHNIQVYHADGTNGWPPEAPYDGIIATAASGTLPEALLAQAAVGGKLIVPLGRPMMSQSLTVLERKADGSTRESCHLPVAFVPMRAGIVAD